MISAYYLLFFNRFFFLSHPPDPILSVSGEPLGREEGLQPDPDDSDITCRGLSED